jgi:hypothetical protein
MLVEIGLENDFEGLAEVLEPVDCCRGEIPDLEKLMSDRIPQVLVH